MSESRRVPRGLAFALCLTAFAWVGAATSIAARAAEGIAVRFHFESFAGLLYNLFLLFLVVIGFRLLDWIATRGLRSAEILPLPSRVSWPSEWGTGVALGWSLCLVAALPVLFSGHLHAHINHSAGALFGVLVSLATLLVAALAQEAIFRGYTFRLLQRALGTSLAALLLSVGFAASLVWSSPPSHLLLALVDGALLGVLLSLAALRTHALWVGWGVHFAYRAVAAVILGLPIAGHDGFGSLADSYAAGPRWLSGGAFGLDAALLTAPILLIGIAVLYRVTRDWAWAYTHAPIVAGGYEVTVAPPPAHTAMERSAPPPPLVQILPTTPTNRSAGASSDGL